MATVLDAIGLVTGDRAVRIEGPSGGMLEARLAGRQEIDGAPAVASAKPGASGKLEVVTTGSVPGALSRRSFEVIGGIGELFRNGERALGPRAMLSAPR